jgi:hypothetical protein
MSDPKSILVVAALALVAVPGLARAIPVNSTEIDVGSLGRK